MYRFVLLTIVLPLSSFAAIQKEEAHCSPGKKHYRTSIRHIESGGIGYEDGYTTLEMFLAPDPNQWKVTPFLDTRGHVFDNGKWAANAGVGLRALWENRAYGINLYYDYRNTSRLNSNQIGMGLETLGELCDFRINGYLPLGAKFSGPYDLVFGSFSGNYMFVKQKYQSAMKGADAEWGFHFGKSKFFDFYAAAGPYYFIGKKTPATWGGKARISGTYKDILNIEISDSYDGTFQNKFQGQVSLSFSFGPKSKVKQEGRTCKMADTLNDRMLQPVGRQEIIVIDKFKKSTIAIDPATGLPYFFVFVNNISNSNGTYESPYHSLTQAQENSAPGNIIYVLPGDGSTRGMATGIFLQENQKFWGSGTGHWIQTTEGPVLIPPQTNGAPTITNTDINTEGNVVTLANNNSVSGFTIDSASNDAIIGTNIQNLEVSSCKIENATRFSINASFPSTTFVSLTNNNLSNNTNGIFLTFNGPSNLICSNNTFESQSSISSIPLEIDTHNNYLTAQVENNIFNNNITGSIRFNITNLLGLDANIINNKITNNGTGSISTLGSSVHVLADGTNNNCSINLKGNLFSRNTSNSLFLDTAGTFTDLSITASSNTMSNNGGSAIALSTPVDILTLRITDNIITQCNDNGIAVIASGLSTTGNLVISGNSISDLGNMANGIAINQNFTNLNLTISNNLINQCAGTGVLSYPSTGNTSLALNISNNSISNCENQSSNAASGLDIEQFINLEGSVTNNTFTGNTGTTVLIGSTLTAPTACLTFTGNNSSTDYLLTNPMDGTFNLTPCNVNSVNGGTINTSGTIELVESCSNPTPCPP